MATTATRRSTNGDTDKLVWASEYGQPTSVSSDAEQAAYLQDMLTTWRTMDYTGAAFVYTLEDDQTGSSDPEATFGLIRSDGMWKPAAYVVRDLATSSSTRPAMARMALAMPEAPQAAQEDLVSPTPTVSTPPIADPVLVAPTLAEPRLAEPTTRAEQSTFTDPTSTKRATSTPSARRERPRRDRQR